VNVTRREVVAGIGLAAAAPAWAQQQRTPDVVFVPTPAELVEKMLDLARLTPADYLIDLGCGDGRIPIAAGRRGARALGVELDSNLVAKAAAYARGAGLTGRVRFRRQDLFETPIHDATVVALYLLPELNLRLRPRLLTELPAGARVVSHAFDMGDWEHDQAEAHDGRGIYLWHVPAVAGGSWQLQMGEGRASRALELEQRFQHVQGTVSAGSTSIPVAGRLQGTALTLESKDRDLRLRGRVDGAAIVGADGSWRATRLS
jgi:SAM-dependent methyltransferase